MSSSGRQRAELLSRCGANRVANHEVDEAGRICVRASMHFPPPLEPGSRVALVAPSGPLAGPVELENAKENSRIMGWEPVVGAHALARDGYLAGSDAERAADLDAALRDDSIDGIWCIRGGYGAMRILSALDYGPLAKRG